MEDIRVRNLNLNQDIKNTDYLVGETRTGTKLFHMNDVKTFLNSSMVFDTVEDMQKCETLNEGDFCCTRGYRKINDNGAGFYTIKYSPTSIPDNGTIIGLKKSDTLRACLIVTAPTVNVTQFGAYGDGVHDDTKAIQTAIDTKQDVVFNANCDYKITSTINLVNDNQIINVNNSFIRNSNIFSSKQ